MGFSPKHSTLIDLILNLRTHSITPQFHVVFDGTFYSVQSNNDTLDSILDSLCKTPSCRIQVPLDKDVSSDLDEEWITEGEALARSTAECQDILTSSGPPDGNYQESILPRGPEDSPRNSPPIRREDLSTSIH